MKLEHKSIVLGGGCFWCTEALFSRLPGVTSVEVGYAGGRKVAPTYEEVCSGSTGHAEVVRVNYINSTISLEKIVENFFSYHDPTLLNQQGNDVGTQYRSIILVNSQKDLEIVKQICASMQKTYPDPIVTEIKLLDKFWPAEDYHKEYFDKHPNAPYCKLVIAPKVEKLNK